LLATLCGEGKALCHPLHNGLALVDLHGIEKLQQSFFFSLLFFLSSTLKDLLALQSGPYLNENSKSPPICTSFFILVLCFSI